MKTIDLPINSKSGIHDLLEIANELALTQLIDRIQELLIKNKPSWLKKDLIGFLCSIFNDKRYKKIQDFIMDTICIDPEPSLFELKNFPTLERDIVLKFIKRDDLAIEEVDVWKYLVKWAVTQFNSLSEETSINADVNNWGDNEYTLFKNNMKPFVSYIRFCEMTRDEFYYHVMPYEKALPENLYKSLIAYFMANLKPQDIMLQPRNGLISIDSDIIKRKNARIIIKWNEGINVFTEKPPYKFTRIYRATRYDFDFEKFIELFRSLPSSPLSNVLLLIKVKDSDKTIGAHMSSKK
ncbi:20892_t:CDS:2, partial [Dentiscutata erythropus]